MRRLFAPLLAVFLVALVFVVPAAIAQISLPQATPYALVCDGKLVQSAFPCPVTVTAGTGTATQADPAVIVRGASGNVANASAAATLAANATKRTWISSFQCTASGSTAALVVDATVAGVTGGTMTYTFTFPAGATVGASPLIVEFPTPVPSSAVNTAIVVTLPAGGAGNAHAACSAQGFQQ